MISWHTSRRLLGRSSPAGSPAGASSPFSCSSFVAAVCSCTFSAHSSLSPSASLEPSVAAFSAAAFSAASVSAASRSAASSTAKLALARATSRSAATRATAAALAAASAQGPPRSAISDARRGSKCRAAKLTPGVCDRSAPASATLMALNASGKMGAQTSIRASMIFVGQLLCSATSRALFTWSGAFASLPGSSAQSRTASGVRSRSARSSSNLRTFRSVHCGPRLSSSISCVRICAGLLPSRRRMNGALEPLLPPPSGDAPLTAPKAGRSLDSGTRSTCDCSVPSAASAALQAT
mmetsp:Transcript_46531/g.83919  ORF Transcript_46531/g.83919 Transcript_46531/m.83919 type:complete len:295 (-) Transcript_46531:308-1192(-)